MGKSELRNEYLNRRKALTRGRYWTYNENILDQIRQMDWSAHRVVHLFLPITENKEVDTFSILQFFNEHYPQIGVVVPRTDFTTLTMVNVLFDKMYTILGKNKYGIPEPIHGKIITEDQIDVVFMPLLAFDTLGNRVGYGKGFYDRFLAGCRPDVLKVGLSFFGPVETIDDLNEFDHPMNLCITPEKIWRFSSEP
jgi:5-formyltetrahydrofolate cyclo-ligase